MQATRDWAVVTGATSGIGRAFTEVLAENGINLIMSGRNGTALATQATVLEKKHGVRTIVYASDLTTIAGREGFLETIFDAKVRLKYLINSAGFGLHGEFMKTKWQHEQNMLRLNIGTVMYLTKKLAPLMVKQGYGRIVNLASTAAFLPGPRMGVYYATKAFVLSFSEALAAELRPKGVRVTALCPGSTATKFAATANAQRTMLFSGNLPTPEAVARYGYKAMMRGKPIAIFGIKNKLLLFGARLLPRSWVTKLVARFQ